MFGTLQSRLANELKFNRISSLEEANAYLEAFIIDYNLTHALPLNHTQSVMEKKLSMDEIDIYLAIVKNRIVDNGGTIKIHNKTFYPIDEKEVRVNIRPKTQVLVIQSFSGKLYLHLNETYYVLLELSSHYEHSSEFDLEVSKIKKTYSPPINHPWKQTFMKRHLKKLTQMKKDE